MYIEFLVELSHLKYPMSPESQKVVFEIMSICHVCSTTQITEPIFIKFDMWAILDIYQGIFSVIQNLEIGDSYCKTKI